ncbi:MAG TPA: amidohydrolase [Candidatus Baltobacteraceae bacterium]|nr:amidohydrolase [Candidatus Baltobacteraceae bacterium]
MRRRFPDAEVVDFENGVVVPGFNDAHTHLAIAAEDASSIDLSYERVRSNADACAILAAQAAQIAPGKWLRASHYDDGKTHEQRALLRWDLDGVSTEHPIFVHHVAGHWCVVNSAALRLAGISELDDDPEGGKYGRDGAGRLNGIVHERAMEKFWSYSGDRSNQLLPNPGTEERLSGLEKVQRAFHASGITSITDALVAPDDFELFQLAARRELLTLRVNMLLTSSAYDAFRALHMSSGFGDRRLRFCGIKAFADGAIGGRTCLVNEPFEGTNDDFGIQSTSDTDLRDIIRLVHSDGNRICVHANGDRAITKVLDNIEAARDEFPSRRGISHRIEHCTIVTLEIVDRIHASNVIPVPFASYVHYHGKKLLDWYGKDRVERMFAHRWFIEKGIPVAASSDYPCGPFEPLLGIQSCVTRAGFDGAGVGLSQRITPDQALSLYTVNAANACGEASVKGRLAPGFLADFVVLDAHPQDVDPHAISQVKIRATFVGGKSVWQAPL